MSMQSKRDPEKGITATAPGALIEEDTSRPLIPQRVSGGYIWALGLAQFGLFFALLSPIFVSMSLKATELNPSSPETVVGSVLPLGALGALIGNPLFGALSDRTRTRWGRRRPWILGGILVFVGSLAWIASSGDVLQLALGWLLAQLSANAVFAAITASFADNVPEFQRGKASSAIALAQNIAILAGIYLAVYLVGNLPMLFIAPGIFAIIAVLVYCFVAKDELPAEPLKRFTWTNLVSSFWTNPIKNPDFGWAWWGRFLMTFGTFMFTTYRVLYMEDHIGLAQADAVAAVAFGVLLYTIALLVSAAISGWASDRFGRRKVFVWTSTALTAAGLVLLAHAGTVEMFYLAEIILGFAYGVYVAIDTALIVDVLPNPDRPGKDLGVINIANALPQSLAPVVGLWLLHAGSTSGGNYTLMLWGAGFAVLLGALVIFPIKSVR
ncbi:MFS transporter [Paenarthrobacter sp. NPDC089714]|uniref:MFS transporter n=1 Tax=Paenarthrobacter sp. NPDC089714 TaxID=3364377 RepID=UPI0037FC11BD